MPEVKVVALEHDIPVFQPQRIKDDYQAIIDMQPDLIITAAYGQMIPQEVLDCPRLGCINVHASLLPKYRGGAPVHYAILNGDEKNRSNNYVYGKKDGCRKYHLSKRNTYF